MRPLASCSHRVFVISMLTGFTAPRSNGQTQQPFLFTGESSNGQITDIAVFVRNDQSGELTEVAGSPFTAIHSHSCGMSIADPKGRFGYGPCGLGAAMYSINGTTGGVAEVSGSPFGASTDTNRGAVAAEATGQFVYVMKYSLSDSYPTLSSVSLDTFAVDAANQQLVAQSSQTIWLSGIGGIVAQIGVVGNGSTSASISAGQSAQFNLQALPGTGFSGTLALTCTGAPVAATCSIPASVAISNGTTATFAVTVSTTGAPAALPHAIRMPRTPFALPGLYATALLLIFYSTLRKETNKVNRGGAWRWRAAGISVAVLLATLAGCGGGGSAGGGSNSTTQTTTVVTPSGTYTIVVTPTATANGTTKQFQLSPLSLTVTVK